MPNDTAEPCATARNRASRPPTVQRVIEVQRSRKESAMSAQGGSLQVPVQVPIRPLLVTTAALLLTLAIGFGIARLAQEPATGVTLQWQGRHLVATAPTDAVTTGVDRFVGNRGVDRSVADARFRMPEQRLYPN